MSEVEQQVPVTEPAAPPQSAPAPQTDEIINHPKLVKAFGREYQIGRFTLGPAFRAVEYVGPFGFLLKTIMQFPRENGKIKASENELLELAVTAITISGPSAVGLISVATGEPVEWLEDKDPFDGLEVLAAILEKNMDFFSPENIARLTRMFGGLQRAILNHGGSISMS